MEKENPAAQPRIALQVRSPPRLANLRLFCDARQSAHNTIRKSVLIWTTWVETGRKHRGYACSGGMCMAREGCVRFGPFRSQVECRAGPREVIAGGRQAEGRASSPRSSAPFSSGRWTPPSVADRGPLHEPCRHRDAAEAGPAGPAGAGVGRGQAKVRGGAMAQGGQGKSGG